MKVAKGGREECIKSGFTKYNLGDEIKEVEMGGVWGRRGERRKCLIGYGFEKLAEGDYMENLGVDGR